MTSYYTPNFAGSASSHSSGESQNSQTYYEPVVHQTMYDDECLKEDGSDGARFGQASYVINGGERVAYVAVAGWAREVDDGVAISISCRMATTIADCRVV
jgi:hypothetical protein